MLVLPYRFPGDHNDPRPQQFLEEGKRFLLRELEVPPAPPQQRQQPKQYLQLQTEVDNNEGDVKEQGACLLLS